MSETEGMQSSAPGVDFKKFPAQKGYQKIGGLGERPAEQKNRFPEMIAGLLGAVLPAKPPGRQTPRARSNPDATW